MIEIFFISPSEPIFLSRKRKLKIRVGSQSLVNIKNLTNPRVYSYLVKNIHSPQIEQRTWKHIVSGSVIFKNVRRSSLKGDEKIEWEGVWLGEKK